MHYTYVLRSDADGRFYIGATKDLRARVAAHEQGRVRATPYRRPLRLVYYETCLSPTDAYRRLSSWLSEVRGDKLERH